jgi:hypothetical protein
LATDEVRELHRITHEKDRRVVADEVVIALSRVKLQRETAHVAPRVGAALLARDSRESREHVRHRAFLKQRRFGVLRHVLSRLEHAERPRAFGVRLTLDHLLAIKMRHLLKEMDVMQQHGAVRTDRQRIAVTGGRGTGSGGGIDAAASGRIVSVCHGLLPATM